MKGWVLVIVLLLAIPAAAALHIQTQQATRECRTRMDCITLLRTTQVLCAPGFTATRQPECSNGKCQFCVPIQHRPRVDCRVDMDCAGKVACSGMLVPRCVGSKCVCSAARPECVTDRDCTRVTFLQRTYQRMVCQRGKCVAPSPLVTMLPRTWTTRPASRY